MAGKTFFLTLLWILVIQCIESKKAIRSFVVIQDKRVEGKPISDFTVFDSTGKKQLYRLRTAATDIDTAMLVDYPAKNMVANAEGVWLDGKVNVTLSIYVKKLNKWVDGTIKSIPLLFRDRYRIVWNSKPLIIKCKFFTKTIKIYNEQPEELIAEFRHRARWLNKLRYNYDLQIYSDKLPDAIYLLALTIMHHKDPAKTTGK